METPARRCGRPRSAEVDRAILAAARAALVELGWSRLTMGDVAARAQVAKTTLYRRWASKNELVVEAVAALFDERLELPDHGSLHADVTNVVWQFAQLLARPESSAALTALMAEAAREPAVRERMRSALVDRQKSLVLLGRRRAQERGELPVESDPRTAARQADLIFDVIAGSVVHRVLVTAEPVDHDWVRDFTALLLTGLASASAPAHGGSGDGGEAGSGDGDGSDG